MDELRQGLIDALREEADRQRGTTHWNYDTIEVKVADVVATALENVAEMLKTYGLP